MRDSERYEAELADLRELVDRLQNKIEQKDDTLTQCQARLQAYESPWTDLFRLAIDMLQDMEQQAGFSYADNVGHIGKSLGAKLDSISSANILPSLLGATSEDSNRRVVLEIGSFMAEFTDVPRAEFGEVARLHFVVE